ncbi:MAG: GNAT family N-acetyltransferase [Treponema sp.]|nr:GNAT family N-acetyltransferase [Treponema sp.]MCL2252346.1 GNAT family N-acetyltransferase [Treponema sp.]
MNENIKIEIIKTAADKEQLKNLYREAGWWNESDNADPDLINKIIKGSFCFVTASLENKLIGMGRAISDGVCDSYIQDVAVLNEFRGKGIGKMIMDELTDYLKSKNITWITLVSEPAAVSFYQKYGFLQMNNYIPFKLNI